MVHALSPGSMAEIPGLPVWVVEYHQDKLRPQYGSCQTQPGVWWREHSLVPGAHVESDKSGPHQGTEGGHHPLQKVTCAVLDPGRHNPEKQRDQESAASENLWNLTAVPEFSEVQ